MKAYRCTKQARRRRPRRTGARAPSPEYRIGDRHMRSQRAKQEIMLDHFAGHYNKRNERIHRWEHPLHVPARAVEQPCQAAFDLPCFMLAHDDDCLF
jgi:hypothetical protein